MYSFVPLVHIAAAVLAIIELGLMAYGEFSDTNPRP
jgi:hypothetical protein